MTRQILAIDIDDVIADSTESLRIEVNRRLGTELQREHYRVEGEYWGYYERVWSTHGIADRVPMRQLDDQMLEDQSHVPLLPGASFAIGEISKRYDIAIVTARNPAWEQETLRWLQTHFGDVFISVHFAGNRHLPSGQTKGELCKDVGAFMLIDDNPGHCKSALDVGLETILFGEYGWHYDIPEAAVRCKDWPEVLERLGV